MLNLFNKKFFISFYMFHVNINYIHFKYEFNINIYLLLPKVAPLIFYYLCYIF